MITDLNSELKHTWDRAIDSKIGAISKGITKNDGIQKVLFQWHKAASMGIKYDYSPHINGFYMIFMQSGTWFEHYLDYLQSNPNKGNLSDLPSTGSFLQIKKSFPILATDIDVPDITKEYISTSSRLRNSFVASRDYFNSDFGLNYIEDDELTIIKYHEAWHKYINLVKSGELTGHKAVDCSGNPNGSYFIDVPYANAVWVAVFKPFTTDISLLIKFVGVMPVNMPLKSVVGNRSQSKMTTLNMMYKASNMFYKFYDGTEHVDTDEGELAKSFKEEILDDYKMNSL